MSKNVWRSFFAVLVISMLVLTACTPGGGRLATVAPTLRGAIEGTVGAAVPTLQAAVTGTVGEAAPTLRAAVTGTVGAAAPTVEAAVTDIVGTAAPTMEAAATGTPEAAGSPTAGAVPVTGGATNTPNPSVSGEVEIFSWWVGPGEADGLAAMVEVMNAQYPNLEFVNAAVAGGAGTNAKAVLATRLSAGNPPDSWQAHAGQETIANYVPANQVQPLDEFFAQQGLNEVLPETLIPLISADGHPYSVPVNIHRSNVMWYNPQVLQEAGVSAPPTTWEEFFTACDAIMAADKTCLSLGPEGFTVMHLMENVMVGSMGAEAWNGLWTDPPTTAWDSAEVKTALETFARVLTYTNTDASSLSDWQPAAQMVTNGDAAFNIMGDWAYGYFANPAPNGLALEPRTDFDWAPVPGTDGIFVFLSDSFVLPVNNNNPEGTNAFLTVAASRAGQEAFNPLKGSICARTDCDQSLFSEYSQEAAQDWTSDTVVGSLTHGVVAAPAWQTKIDTALKLFLAGPMDATAQQTFQQELADACASDGTCQ